MSVLAKRLVWLVGFVVVFSGFTTALVHSVSYKPYGVPDHRREEYETKIAFLRQRESKMDVVEESADPVVKTGKTIHDFGKVEPHETLTHRFSISNEGDSPLRLTVRETSCKCTVGKLGVPVVLPGETTSVTLEWNTGFMSDEYEQTALIETNDPKKHLIEFKVRGVVRADLVVPEAVHFGKAALGEESQAEFVVFSQLWENFAIESVVPEGEKLDWFAVPLERDDVLLDEKDPRSAWKVTLKRPVLLSEAYSDVLTVTVQPGDGSPSIEKQVRVSGEVKKPIAFISPEIKADFGLDLGTVASDTDHHYHLTVHVRGDAGRPVEVLDVVPKCVQTRLTPGKREGYYRLTLTIPEGAATQSFNRDDEKGYVQVGDPNDPTFQNWFPIYGAVVSLK